MNLSLEPAVLFALGGTVGLAIGLGIALVWAGRIRARLRSTEAELKHQSHLEAERDAALQSAADQLARTFDELANAQFQSHSETFLKLARENLGTHHEKAKGELAAREQAIEGLLRPIRETLQRTEAQLQELDKARRETHGNINAQLAAMAQAQHDLSAETKNLVNALRRPEVRGQWGELTLQRLVELAGMVEHCDFQTQSHTVTTTGSIRPDMIINLPEGRQLIVDVKTPLDAYLEATEATDEASRKQAYVRHAAVVAERIRELASKAYWAQFDRSPEFVILFIPGDQFLAAALAERPGLLDDALRQQIILATPTSLVALLKAVAYGWRQLALAENANEIRALAVDLYERLNVFIGHMAQMGMSLEKSVRDFNKGVSSLERRVLPGARKFTELGIKPREEIDQLKSIETGVRDVPDSDRDFSSSDTSAGERMTTASNEQ